MIDEMFDRNYQSARGELNASLDNGVKGLAKAASNAFRVLQAIQFAAPWARKRGRMVHDA